MSTKTNQPTPLQRQQEQQAARSRERRFLGIVALSLVGLVVVGGIGLQFWRTGRSPSVGFIATSSLAPAMVTNGQPLVLGEAGAPVRLQLYADFHCPHCADFEAELGPTITAEQAAGTVAVELSAMSFIDAGSARAANAMACAAEGGFGPSYYLGLFQNHTLSWSDAQLIQLAGQVSTNVQDSFQTCVTGQQHRAWVDSINAAAKAKGVTSTPTMFLDGNPVDLATLTPASLKSMLDQAAGPT